MSAQSINHVLRQADLPGLPDIYFELEKLPFHASAAQAAALIERDPELARRLLRLINLGLYRFDLPLPSVADAVMEIGRAQVQDLATAVMVLDILYGLSPDIVSAQSYWRHNVACGIAARSLAAQRGEDNIERFFVAGLLHDIGSMLFYVHIPEKALMVILRCRDGNGPLHQLEQDTMGFDHAQLGSALLHAWGLPAVFQEAVACHHTPKHATAYPVEAAAVHVADIMVNAMELGTRGEFVVPPLVPEAWDCLGLSPAVLEVVMDEADSQFAEVAAALYCD